MGTCELCGMDNVSTHQVIASEVKVDACNRCIEKMQLPLFESPFEKISSFSPSYRVNTNPQATCQHHARRVQ